MTNRQQRDAIYSQTGTLAQACEDILTLRDKLEADGVHYSIVAAMDAAIAGVSIGCNELNRAEAMLKQAAEQAAQE